MVQVNTPVVYYDQFDYMIDDKDDEPNKYDSRNNHLPDYIWTIFKYFNI